MDRSKGTVVVQLAQRAILRQRERDRLSHFLTQRPTFDELLKTKQNIMEDTMTWVRCASLTGSIPLPRNCLSEDTRILTERGFMFLDEVIQANKSAPLKYACFNSVTHEIEYHTGELIVKPSAAWSMVSFDDGNKNYDPRHNDHTNVMGHTSLLVTKDHDMYVEIGSATLNGDGWCPLPAVGKIGFTKIAAGKLLSGHTYAHSYQSSSSRPSPPQASNPCLRLLSHATHGVRRDAADRVALYETVLQPLGLHSSEHIDHLMRLYGFYLYRYQTMQLPSARISSVSSFRHLTFSSLTSSQYNFLVATLGDGLELLEGSQWSTNQDSAQHCQQQHSHQLTLIDPRYVDFLEHHLSSAHSLPDWCLAYLDASQVRAMIQGFSISHHSSIAPLSPSHADYITCHTSSAILRDQLVHLGMSGGYSTYFHSSSLSNGPTPMYTVVFVDPSHPSHCKSDILPRSCISSHSTYHGRVWCVTVPTGLIIAQRAWTAEEEISPTAARDTIASSITASLSPSHLSHSREVVRASRPIIVGNCHTMTSFPNSPRMYLLGGYGTGSTTNTDLIILDTANDTWIRPPVGGSMPCERYSHTCSALGNGKLVVFGGFSTNGVWLNDVYVLDTQVAQSFYTKLPPSSSSSSSAIGSRTASTNTSQHHSPILGPHPSHSYAPTQNRLTANSVTATATGTTNQVTSPPIITSTLNSASPPFHPQASHQQHSHPLHQSPSPTLTPHPHSTVTMLMWHQPILTGTIPSPRAAHSAVVVGDLIYLFGGNDGETLFNDLYVLDTTNWIWSAPHVTGSPPSPRAGHTMELISGHSIVLFGGGTADGPVNELYVLDVSDATNLVWSKPETHGTPPSPRAGHSACQFVDNQLLVFGGGYLNKVFNDLHVFNFDTMVWSRPADTGTVPTPRAGHTANVIQSKIYVFAGGDSEHVYNDLHILDTAFLRVHQAQHHQTQQLHHPKGNASSHHIIALSHSSQSRASKSQSAPSSPTRAFRHHHHHDHDHDHDHDGVPSLSLASLGSSRMASNTSMALDGASSRDASVAAFQVAMSKLLHEHARERVEADLALLARFEETLERIGLTLRHVTNLFERSVASSIGQNDPRPSGHHTHGDESLTAAILRTIRTHRASHQTGVKDALAQAQTLIVSEQTELRQMSQLRRAQMNGGVSVGVGDMGMGSGLSSPSSNSNSSAVITPTASTSAFQVMADSNANSNSNNSSRHLRIGEHQAYHSNTHDMLQHSHSLPVTPSLSTIYNYQHPPPSQSSSYLASDSDSHSQTHPHAPSHPHSHPPLAPPPPPPMASNIQRSTSAEGPDGRRNGAAAAAGGGGGGNGKLLKNGSSSNLNGAMASPSLSSSIPPAPALGPPGTPNKRNRKRGGKFKQKIPLLDGMSELMIASNSSSLQGTPVMRPMQPAESTSVSGACHSHGMSKSSVSSIGSAMSSTSASSSISPTNVEFPNSEMAPPRQHSPNTPDSDNSSMS